MDASGSDKRSRRAGRPPIMDRAMIAQAALAEIDGISSTKVARRLGVGQSSLYRHVSSRDELVHLAIDFALEKQQWPNAGEKKNWRDYLTEFVTSFWHFLKQHPGSAQQIKTLYPSPRRLIEAQTELVTGLIEFGFDGTDAAVASELLGHIALDIVVADDFFGSTGQTYNSRDTTAFARNRHVTIKAEWPESTPEIPGTSTQIPAKAPDQPPIDKLLARTQIVLDGLQMRLERKLEAKHEGELDDELEDKSDREFENSKSA